MIIKVESPKKLIIGVAPLLIKRILLFFFIATFFVSCQKDDPVKPTNAPPILSNFNIPDTIFTKIDQSYIISVVVTDEDGLEDIASVNYEIVGPQGSSTTGDFYDNGDFETHGDNIAKDGKYSARLNIDFPTGVYQITAKAIDKSELESDPLEETFYAIEGKINHAPTVTAVQIPDSVYVDKSVPFIIQIRAEDVDSDDYVTKVTYQILGPTISELAQEGELIDDGSSGDQTAGDGIYSIETTTEFALWKFGTYHLYIQAFDSNNKGSESLYKIIPWAKMEIGIAPQIFNLAVPDTINLPSSQPESYLLTITVTDEDNNNDIKEVFFDTYKPDGSLSASSPLQMYDDGTSGDITPGDNIYSLMIHIWSSNSTGDYRFEFQARDYSNLLSNEIIHIMTVIE